MPVLRWDGKADGHTKGEEMTHEEIILSVLTTEAKHIDTIVKETGLSPRDTSAALTYLLLAGEVLSEPGMKYKKGGDPAKHS